MEVSLKDIKPEAIRKMFKQQEENRNCTKTTTLVKTEFTLNDDDSALLASLPTADVKIRKHDESKLLMDNNENSLSVDTLIEILSSNETNNKLPISEFVPPLTLISPSSSSSSSKAGLVDIFSSQGPSPKSISPKMFPSPFHLNGGKPMISDMNKKMKQVSKRQPRTVYQSQISDNSIGIKLRIKKSNSSQKNKASPKKRSRRTKARGQESDSDDAYVKRRKKSSTGSINNNNNNKTADEPVEQSGWGKEMPKEILFDVSSLNCDSAVLKVFVGFRFSRWQSRKKAQFQLLAALHEYVRFGAKCHWIQSFGGR